MTETYTYEQRLVFLRDGLAMAITETCDQLYELFEQGFPHFVREEFIDRTRLVRAYKSGNFLDEDYVIFDVWATITEDDDEAVKAYKRDAFSAAVLDLDRRYTIARQSLRQFYDAGLIMAASCDSFEGQNGAQVIATQFITTGEAALIPALAAGDKKVEEVARSIIENLTTQVANMVDGVQKL